MRIVIPGGTGQMGNLLARAFTKDGHQVVVLSRAPVPRPWRVIAWDARTPGVWVSELDGADAVINLAGRSVNCRYNAQNRREIIESRVFSTRAIGQAIASVNHPPAVWLQASTATIYSHRYDAPNDEVHGIIGGAENDAPDTWRFSIEVARSWERALDEAVVPRTRKVKLRSAMTMSPDRGGIFDVLLGLVRRGFGGTSGDGRQFVSWIHEQDFVRAIYFLVRQEGLDGPVNLASPNPLPNAEFMENLRAAWGIKFGLPAGAWLLEIGAVFLRTETELILKSRRVVPGRLVEHGFRFDFPAWPEAAQDLCQKWREGLNSFKFEGEPS
jgi:uncharacterized protein (TIGR01777 family)